MSGPPRRTFTPPQRLAARRRVAEAVGGRGIADPNGDHYEVTLHDKFGNVSHHDYFTSLQQAQAFADEYTRGVYSLQDGTITRIDPIRFIPGTTPDGSDKARLQDLLFQAKKTLKDGKSLGGTDPARPGAQDLWKSLETLKANWVDVGTPGKPAPGDAPQTSALVMGQQETQKFLNDHKALVDQVKNHERVRSDLYLDSKGILTGAVGFNMERPDARPIINALGGGADYASLLAGAQRFTSGQMDRLLATDLGRSMGSAQRVLGKDAGGQSAYDGLNSQRQDVLTELAYNMGAGRLSGFKQMLNDVRQGDYRAAAEEMIRSKWYGDVGGDSSKAGPGNRALQLVQQMGGIAPAEQKQIRKAYLDEQDN